MFQKIMNALISQIITTNDLMTETITIILKEVAIRKFASNINKQQVHGPKQRGKNRKLDVQIDCYTINTLDKYLTLWLSPVHWWPHIWSHIRWPHAFFFFHQCTCTAGSLFKYIFPARLIASQGYHWLSTSLSYLANH